MLLFSSANHKNKTEHADTVIFKFLNSLILANI